MVGATIAMALVASVGMIALVTVGMAVVVAFGVVGVTNLPFPLFILICILVAFSLAPVQMHFPFDKTR